MARVDAYGPNRVRETGPTDARFRNQDLGRGPLAPALDSIGDDLNKTAAKFDEIEDINARTEANRLSVEFAERGRLIGKTVSETLGEGASAAAEKGGADLEAAAKEVLGKASPRARRFLEADIGTRVVTFKDRFDDHGFREKATAFEASGKARIDHILEDAADEDDETRAKAIFAPTVDVLREQARFFGRDSQWVEDQVRTRMSALFKSRSLKLAVGPNGSSIAAIEYANTHRNEMSDDDYNAVVSSYNGAALDEVATAELWGMPAGTASGDLPASADPTASLPDGSPPPASTRRLDPKAFFSEFTVKWEGAATVVDSNGAVAKYGINAEHNPGVDVANLTQPAAAKIFTKKYFEKSGADKLPPALAAVHVDTFYLNESKAMQFLKECGGDVDKYLKLRNDFLNGLARKNPGKFGRYQKGWQNRTNDLAAFAARQGGAGVAPNIEIGEHTDMENVRSSIMERNDIGLALKTRMIQLAEGRYSEVQQAKRQREGDAADELTTAITGLGDKFTDVKQLPQDAWLHASPQTRASLTEAARSNRENKPLSPDVIREIEFVEVTDPKRFASKEYLLELTRKGVPASKLRDIAARQGQIAGNLANPKAVDPISDGSLWTIAKPAFEAAGILTDTIESTGKAKAKERQADTVRQQAAIRYLRDGMTRWMAANPGKKPDDETIRKMVGWSLREIHGKPAFEASYQENYMAIPERHRQRIMRELYGSGPRPATDIMMKDVVDTFRTMTALSGR